jgi:hypothetical protein
MVCGCHCIQRQSTASCCERTVVAMTRTEQARSSFARHGIARDRTVRPMAMVAATAAGSALTLSSRGTTTRTWTRRKLCCGPSSRSTAWDFPGAISSHTLAPSPSSPWVVPSWAFAPAEWTMWMAVPVSCWARRQSKLQLSRATRTATAKPPSARPRSASFTSIQVR